MLKHILVAGLVASRVFSASYMIIADCDETFNYWEPLNFILRGFGKETWEYSPEYAIRSYSYLWPYFVTGKLLLVSSKTIDGEFIFYFLRFTLLCGFTGVCEYRLYRSVARTWGSTIACWFLFFTTVSTGMQHAGVALLPSSWAMNWVSLATSASIDALRKNTLSAETKSILVSYSTIALVNFIVAGVLGWPFALALAVPFGLYTLGYGIANNWASLSKIVLFSLAGTISICGVVIAIDTHYYQKVSFVPLNIVLYNVFGGEGEGPEIFGVEDFSYYPLNLLLNFNAIFILAVCGVLITPIIVGLNGLITVLLPLIIWGLIFASQPHKEERFLYPIYPLICLSGAIFTFSAFQVCRKFKIPHVLIRLAQLGLVVVIASVSILRTISLVENYGAPLEVFSKINSNETDSSLINVCTGREWYHFPTSFFLPEGYRLRFVKSGFNGLLPGDFLEGTLTALDSTLQTPPNMNNKNLFEQDKVIPFEACHFYVDNNLPVDAEVGEYQIIDSNSGLSKDWEIIKCNKMIKADGQSSALGRLLYIPKFARKYINYKVDYMDFCLLKRKEGEV